ncbi:MAG TPA: Imm1 family immunity protein [Pseudonocardiaceae bacterium]|nr:Imm1 family immunity protein [Pseudonocardiaceae bacterium]
MWPPGRSWTDPPSTCNPTLQFPSRFASPTSVATCHLRSATMNVCRRSNRSEPAMTPLELWYSHDQAEGRHRHHSREAGQHPRQGRGACRTGLACRRRSDTGSGRQSPVLYPGFHLELGAVYYSGRDARGPYYTRGEGQPGGSPLVYMYATSDNELPSNSEIPVELVRQAVHEFADTGRRPTCVSWQTWDRPNATTE